MGDSPRVFENALNAVKSVRPSENWFTADVVVASFVGARVGAGVSAADGHQPGKLSIPTTS
jgi:hypothetical protein